MTCIVLIASVLDRSQKGKHVLNKTICKLSGSSLPHFNFTDVARDILQVRSQMLVTLIFFTLVLTCLGYITAKGYIQGDTQQLVWYRLTDGLRKSNPSSRAHPKQFQTMMAALLKVFVHLQGSDNQCDSAFILRYAPSKKYIHKGLLLWQSPTLACI